MKRIVQSFLLLAFFGVFTSSANAQDAPDFTLTDLDGNEQHLYTYLDDGKAVIIDFFTTWCGPCWTLHQTHVLEDTYQQFGPNGADILMAMAIECDDGTTLADLMGTGGNTTGNWLDGSSYPYVDLTTDELSVPTSYGVSAYPTIMMIRPDKTIRGNLYGSVPSTVDSWSSEALNVIEPTAGVDMTGFNAEFRSPACGSSMATMSLMNKGDQAIEKVNVVVMVDGSEVSNSDMDLSIGSLEIVDAEIPIDGLPLGQDSDVELIVTPEGGEAATFNGFVAQAASTDNYVTVKITGDGTAQLDGTNWEVVGSNGTVYGSGDIMNNEVIDVKVYVDEVGCYEFKIADPFFGDGLSGGSVYVETSNGDVLMDASNFGASASADFYASTVSSVDAEDIVLSSVYPNPSAGQFTVTLSDDIQLPATLKINNQLGQLVHTQVISQMVETIDLDVKSGTYVSFIEGKNGKVSVENLVIQD